MNKLPSFLQTFKTDNNENETAEMTKLMNALPRCPANEKGELKAYGGQNEFNSSHKAIAESKNWVVKGM